MTGRKAVNRCCKYTYGYILKIILKTPNIHRNDRKSMSEMTEEDKRTIALSPMMKR